MCNQVLFPFFGLQLALIQLGSQRNRVFLSLLFSSSSITIPLTFSPLFPLNLRIFLSDATASRNEIKYSTINKKRYFRVV